MQFTVKMVLKTVNVQMLAKITIIHSFVAIYCQNGSKICVTFKCFQKLQLSIALMQFTFKTVQKTFNLQMLPEMTIINYFIAIDCQNGTLII